MEHLAPQSQQFEIVIAYNGLPRPLRVNPHQQVTAVLQHALQLFGIKDRPHAYGLFYTNGDPVPENSSVESAKIVAGTELFLREKIVQGGAA